MGNVDLGNRPALIEELVPPQELNFVGPGNFTAIGQEFFHYFVSLAGLRPHERVLDVGCGIGRIAIPLTQYLRPPGRYEGFDVVPVGIDWCQSKIASRYPHFRFRLVEIYNQHYAPKARTPARKFRFPYPSESFDFVFLTSVFTHMLPADLENYVYEITRVLRSGGRCLMTFFLLNPESQALTANKQGTISFPHPLCASPCSLQNPNVPEQAVAYEEGYVRKTLQRYGFDSPPEVHYGNWCGRKDHLSYQDVIIARKVRSLSWGERITHLWTRFMSLARHQPLAS
jgi:ubiquinone/menaquinone biosynthesis C-methylase UbiE